MIRRIGTLVFAGCFCLSFAACNKAPTTPETPQPIDGVFEILYERVLPIINPNVKDPTGGWASIWHPTNGGKNSSPWEKIGENRWQADVFLSYSKTPYAIWLNDRKVEETYSHLTAQKISMRPKGDDRWIELICIEKMGLGGEGKWAEFIADRLGIKNPC